MFRKKIRTDKAILIEKKIVNSSKKTHEAVNIVKMKYGIYDSLGSGPKKKTIEYYFYFMTKSGRLAFKVEPQIYHHIKLESLGLLERTGSKYISFTFEKIASKKDIEILDW